MDDVGRQHAMDRRGRPEGHGRIDIVHAQPTCPRGRIGNARLHADPVADLEAGHTGADLDHGARCLVAEHHRCIDDEWSDPSVSVVVHVRSTHAHRVELYLHRPRPCLHGQVDVAEGKLVLPFQHQGTRHGHVILLKRPAQRRRRLSSRRAPPSNCTLRCQPAQRTFIPSPRQATRRQPDSAA